MSQFQESAIPVLGAQPPTPETTNLRLVDVKEFDLDMELVSSVSYYEGDLHPLANTSPEISDIHDTSQSTHGMDPSSLLLIGGRGFRPTQTRGSSYLTCRTNDH